MPPGTEATHRHMNGTDITPRHRGRTIFRAAVVLLAAALLVPLNQVLLLRFVDPPVTAMMLWKSAGTLCRGERVAWRYQPRPAGEISPHLLRAVLAAEDQRFFDHRGFDFVEIEKAQRQAERRKARRPMRGASTLTQQAAKNLFLPPVRSIFRKGVEAYYTLLMELCWPKDRILEVYVNVVEFAPGVYGAQAAARHHFRRDAGRLSRQQAALLAAVLPNPARWSASRPTDYIRRRAARIVADMPAVPASQAEADRRR